MVDGTEPKLDLSPPVCDQIRRVAAEAGEPHLGRRKPPVGEGPETVARGKEWT